MEKRQFLKRLGQAALLSPFLPADLYAHTPASETPYPKENEEAFWERIRADYKLKPDYINLENGYYNFTPLPIMQQYIKHIQMVNYEASYYMRTVQWENKNNVAKRLAKLVGCASEELILTRNTTESLDMIIGGFPWEKDDEAIFAEQDYGSMQDHFHQIAKRYGVVNKIVSIPNHPESDEALGALYEQQITSKTKLLMLSHMVNITGHIMPVQKICDMAHSHGWKCS